MSNKKSNPYTLEFKQSSVKLAIESDLPVSQTAKNLGIKPATLYTWINQYSKSKENSAVHTNESIQEELKRLKKEVVRLTQERDILKKATAYFAREIV